MEKAWKVVVLVVLAAAVVAAVGLKRARSPGPAPGAGQEPPSRTLAVEQPKEAPRERTNRMLQDKPLPRPAPSTERPKPAAATPRAADAVLRKAQKRAPCPAASAKDVLPSASAPREAPAAEPSEQPAALPKLLDLGAGKCIPCKMMAPILEELKKECAGKLEVVFVDVWEDREAGERYNIRSIPTQIFYDAEGNELSRHVGFFSKEDILGRFKEYGIHLGGG